jgi:hypothetical protein
MLRIMIASVTVAATTVLFVGCATTDDSDIPWASPAPWEGSPYIPGLSE